MALEKHWPEMEKVLEFKLVYKNDFLFYDDNKESYENYEKVAKSSNGQLVISTPEEIVEKYENVPLIKSKFPPIIDQKAAMIAADDYIIKLAQYLKSRPNVSVFENTLVRNVKSSEKEVLIEI